jgi:hypothetical protein
MQPQKSQAIDLLEYDLARLEIAKQDAQANSDNIMFFSAAGAVCFILARMCNPYDHGPNEAFRMVFGMQLDMGSVLLILFPWFQMLRKMQCERRIEQINERISLLQKK